MSAKCPKCSAALPAGMLEGLCPACLLQQGAMTETALPENAGRFDLPGVEDLARLFPHLEVLGLIGRGGMGAVYKARQRALDRFVALKILPARPDRGASFAERFNREARALARLSHPNIVTVHEFGQAEGMPFFIMEFVDGLNLRQLEQARRLDPKEAIQIIPQICEALQFAHDEGIVHRDIKPENILLDKKGRVKIADFGIAKIMGREEGAEGMAETRNALGTPTYMAPEQAEDPRAVDHRADIYSLGVVFYEMLTGELPAGRVAPPSTKARGVQVDVRLDEVVLRALEKEPELRFQHASQVKTMVETIAAEKAPSPQESQVVIEPFWKPSRLLNFNLFLSREAQEIQTRLTKQEQNQTLSRWRLYFLWTLAALVAGVAAIRWETRASLFFGGVILLTHVASIPFFLTLQRRSLCSAQWARERGFRPERLRLLAFRPHYAETWISLFVFVAVSGALFYKAMILPSRFGMIQWEAADMPFLGSASEEKWAPVTEAGQAPNPAKVMEEARHLFGTGDYEGALQRHIWYHNHALQYDPALSAVRLSFALTYWAELGQRYPKARRALREIRDHGEEEIEKGRGYFELFQEVASINHYLREEEATMRLFQKIEAMDPELARRCRSVIKSPSARQAGFPRVFENAPGQEEEAPALMSRQPEISALSVESGAADSGILEIKLRAADRELAEAKARSEVGVISLHEYNRAQVRRDMLAAELKGDRLEMARLRHEFAARNAVVERKKFEAGVIPFSDYNKAALEQEIAELEYRRLLPKADEQ